MSKRINVHPDYYKTAGRDRQDDAAAARQARAAKAFSQQSPDRMAKDLYYQRPEPVQKSVAGGRRKRSSTPAAKSQTSSKASVPQSKAQSSAPPTRGRRIARPKRASGRSAKDKIAVVKTKRQKRKR